MKFRYVASLKKSFSRDIVGLGEDGSDESTYLLGSGLACCLFPMESSDVRAARSPALKQIRRPQLQSVTRQWKLSSDGDSQQSLEQDWIIIHPTRQTRMFKEVLTGQLGYTDGQGIYNSVRSTEAAIRQIQSTILTLSLDAVRYDDLKEDWSKHMDRRGMSAKEIAKKYGVHSEAEAVRMAKGVFSTWRKTLQMTLIELVRHATDCFAAAEKTTSCFSKYIDWICCLGIVPVVRSERSMQASRPDSNCRDRATIRPNWVFSDATAKLLVADSVMARAQQIADYLTASMQALTVIEYDRAQIEYNFLKRELRVKDVLSGERGECIVIWRPVMNDGGVIFDSPMQRIYKEMIECHDLRMHAALCRLVNTAPIKVLIGKRDEDSKSMAGAQRAIDKVLGDQTETAASSAASRLVKLIIGLKGMRHVGDITDRVRDYLEETGGHLLDASPVDTSQPGFGRANRPQSSTISDGTCSNTARLRDAFHASVVTSINEMLEGYINKLFHTVEGLKAANKDLSAKLSSKEIELDRIRTEALISERARADASCDPHCNPTMETLVRELKHDVIDVTNAMEDESYIANSFQSQYIPSYDGDLKRLSNIWEQEMLRCFKMTRITSNQGREVSISYSNSAITLLLAPYFFSVLQIYDIGAMVTSQDVYKSEEELCNSVLEKTRLCTYLDDLALVFEADVKRAVAKYSLRAGNAEIDLAPEEFSYGSHGSKCETRFSSARHERHVGRSSFKHAKWRSRPKRDRRRTNLATDGADDDGDPRDSRRSYSIHGRLRE